MIVCICTATCERRLEAVIAEGAHTVGEVERRCGAGGDCGSCRPDIERVIERVTLGAPRHGSLPVLAPGTAADL